MSRPRLILRRLFPRAVFPLRPPPTRTAASAAASARPQIPFLASPTPRQQQQYRSLTTGRRNWFKQEAIDTAYYAGIFGLISIFGWAIYFAVREERLERQYPTPDDWGFVTRIFLHEGYVQRDRLDIIKPDWPFIFQQLRRVMRRLETPGYSEAEGVRDLERGEEPPHPPGTKDVTGKSEDWRRGYYEVLMAVCKSAEHVDGWVLDRTRGIVFPPEVVIGPSNPNRRPIPPHAASAPKEEDCELAFEERADLMYQKVLGTKGFNPRQRMDAALAYANWLEFKGNRTPAAVMYEQAVEIALEASPSPEGKKPMVNRKSWTLDDDAGLPSENILRSLTAFATFKARQGDLSSAMPMMVSILRARSSLPALDESSFIPASLGETQKKAPPGIVDKATDMIMSIFLPPSYPPPPPDGTAPPVRDAKARCEEAALQMHIGEIMFSTGSAEQGIAWTREAVDTAEEQLHRIGRPNSNPLSISAVLFGGQKRDERELLSRTNVVNLDARAACRECLVAGLDNWKVMVARLAREGEKAAEEVATAGAGGWFGLWGDGRAEAEQRAGRWRAEEKVVEEREARAKRMLNDPDAPQLGPMSLFQV